MDMTEVSFIASLGMRMLLSAAKALRANGAKLVIYNPPACRAGSASDCRFCRSNADRERFFKSIDSFEERLTV